MVMPGRHGQSDSARLAARLEVQSVELVSSRLEIRPPRGNVRLPAPLDVKVVTESENDAAQEPTMPLLHAALPAWPALRFTFQPGEGASLSPSVAVLLRGFLRLGAATDVRVAKFAQRWAPLGICNHGMLRTAYHDSHCESGGRSIRYADGTVETSPLLEPLAAWRHLSVRFQAILEVGRRLLANEPAWRAGAGVLWAASDEQNNLPWIQNDQTVVRKQLEVSIEELVRLADLRPTLVSRDGPVQFSVVLVGGPRATDSLDVLPVYTPWLFPLLVQQLLAWLCSPSRLVACTGCGQPYSYSGRKPRYDRGKYCSEKCRKAAFAEAQRRSARRRRARNSGEVDAG